MSAEKPKFLIYHQPKTGGSYALTVLPRGYVQEHHLNYHKRPPLAGVIPVVILRDPPEYYKSLACFWCLDPRSVDDDEGKGTRPLNRELSKLQCEYMVRIKGTIGHPKYWISQGFTERSMHNVIDNITNPEFIRSHAAKVSLRHHTYDSSPFADMERLGIGYYTWAFLDQCSRKRVSELRREDLRSEVLWITSTFRILRQETLDEDLEKLCREFGLPFQKRKRVNQSKKPSGSDSVLPKEITERIRILDKLVYNISLTA